MPTDNKRSPINVTIPWLPDRKKLNSYIDKIYKSKHLTNHGPLLEELTERLKEYLEVDNLLLVTNGTLALQIAYKVIGINEEVITTPFSFVASTSSLMWERLIPCFADIDQDSLCLDPKNIPSLINSKTSAIVPVHVFGNACEAEKIDSVARANNLKVIYDAAHAFGIRYKNKSILTYGDASILSFHATKIFHTIEGGAIVFNRKEDFEIGKKIINFGINDSGKIKQVGINAKMSEFQAAMGLCILDDMTKIIEKRKVIWERYQQKLPQEMQIQKWLSDNNNYHYFPVILPNEDTLIKMKDSFNAMNIFPRRYFYPSIHSLPIFESIKNHLAISEDISSRILCLPMYPSLKPKDQQVIIETFYQNIP